MHWPPLAVSVLYFTSSVTSVASVIAVTSVTSGTPVTYVSVLNVLTFISSPHIIPSERPLAPHSPPLLKPLLETALLNACNGLTDEVITGSEMHGNGRACFAYASRAVAVDVAMVDAGRAAVRYHVVPSSSQRNVISLKSSRL